MAPGKTLTAAGGSDDNNSEGDGQASVTGVGNTKVGAAVGSASVSASALSSTTSSSALQSYTLPPWLAGNDKPHANKFVIKFPPVLPQTRTVIENYVRQNSSTFLKESTRASHQLRELQRDEDEAQRQLGLVQDKLDRAFTAKQDDLKKIRKEKQKVQTKKLHELERQMRQQQAKEYKKTEARMQEEARTNFEKTYEDERNEEKKKRQREEEEQGGQNGGQEDETTNPADKNKIEGTGGAEGPTNNDEEEKEVEPSAPKKQKTTTSSTAGEGNGEDKIADSDKDKDTDTTNAEVTKNENDVNAKKEEEKESGGGDDSHQKEESGGDGKNENDEEVVLESKIARQRIVELEKKRDKAQTELDRLNERKKEIAWLLKLTIKGEMKQKALLAAQKKAEES